MGFHKVLSASQSVFARSPAFFKKSVGDVATRSAVIYTPPRVRISFPEKMILGVILSISVSIIPVWVLYHVPEYQQEKREKKSN